LAFIQSFFLGIHSTFRAFVFGLTRDGVLTWILSEKIEDFVSSLLLPLCFSLLDYNDHLCWHGGKFLVIIAYVGMEEIFLYLFPINSLSSKILAKRKETTKATSNSILPLTAAHIPCFQAFGNHQFPFVLQPFGSASLYLAGIKSSMDGPKEGGSASSKGLVGAIHIVDGFTVHLTDKVHQLPCCIKYNGQ
jgi:hypothetical protein